MTHIYKPYTYLIGWSEHNKYYYGVRWANTVEPENDFWKIYFTSSNIVKKFRESHGEPDIVKVDKIFDNKNDAINYEYTYLLENNAIKSDSWLNEGAFPVFDNTGRKRPDHSKRMMGENNPMYGKSFSKQAKLKQSNSHKGKKHSSDTKQKMSLAQKGKRLGCQNPFHGKTHSHQVRENLSKVHKNTIWIKKDSIRKRIKEDLVDAFLNDGWVKGR